MEREDRGLGTTAGTQRSSGPISNSPKFIILCHIIALSFGPKGSIPALLLPLVAELTGSFLNTCILWDVKGILYMVVGYTHSFSS